MRHNPRNTGMGGTKHTQAQKILQESESKDEQRQKHLLGYRNPNVERAPCLSKSEMKCAFLFQTEF